MANNTWIGGATAIAQVDTFTPATVEIGDIFTLTRTGENGSTAAISFTATAATAANVAAGLVAAWNASTNALITPITASGSSTVVLTADTAGVPFSVAGTTTDGGGTNTQTLTRAATTAGAGPNDWHTAANWSTGSVPAGSDSVYIDGTSSNAILYGLNQSPAGTANNSVTLTLLKIRQGHPQIGTLTGPLTYKITTLDYGEPPADGSSPSSATIANLKPGDVATAATIRSTNSTGSGGKPPLQISIANSSSTFIVMGNSKVGFGTASNGESVTIGTLTVKDTSVVTCGSGVTLTTLNPELGSTTLNAGVTTINYGLGSVIVRGTGDITTVTNGGMFEWDSSGTITTYNGYGKSLAKLWRGTITDAFIYGDAAKVDASISGIPGNVTITNGVDCDAGAQTNQVNFGDSRNVQQAAP
jgi:hypothetical protein